MWGKLIIVILICAFISGYWECKIEENRKKKRKYKVMQGITYLITAGVSMIFLEKFGQAVMIYMAVAIASGIGSFLTAINSNLRVMYTLILFSVIVMLAIVPHFFKHIIIFSFIYIVLIASVIDCIKESIQNMRDGIDPDVIAEEKAAKRRFGFKIAKLILFIWR